MAPSTSSLDDIRYDHLASAPTSRAGSPPREPVFDEENVASEDPSWAWAWRAQEEGTVQSPGTVLTGRGTGTERLSAGSPSSSKRHSPSELGAGKTTHRRQPTAGKGMQARESRARRSTWTCIYSTGVKTILHSDKRGVIQKFKLGVPIRDMRLLDPNLLTSETGKILVRDNAIVFSIEHVRLIITAEAVIVPREGFDQNPLNTRFNALLEDMIAEFVQEQARILMAAQAEAGAALKRESEADRSDDESSEYQHGVAPLPFELQVLEVAIKDVCQLSSQLTKELEAVAHPALDALTKQVTTGNLERVRKVKTRHQRLFARVQTIREELQRFLEDDDDMMKMCLTRKKELEATGMQRGYTQDGQQVAVSLSGRRHSLSMPVNTPRHTLHEHRTPFTQGSSPPWAQGMDRADSGAALQQGASPEEESDSIEAVENLLESYFMQIDSTHDRLDALGEFIEDTEEYINFSLDSSRNRLLRLEIVLTAGTFGIAMFSLVAGILGENLIIPKAITNNVSQFYLVNVVTLIVCLLFFVGLMVYIRYRRLM